MRRAHALALAVAVVLAGCPAASSDGGTVTPAPVPSPGAQDASTPEPLPCDVPRAESPDETPTTVPLSMSVETPTENGTVNATALIDRHDRTLREHRYQLRAPGLFVQSDPAAPALRVRANTSLTAVRHYVVDGVRYTYSYREGGQQRYEVHGFSADAFERGFGSVYSLTGSDRLTEALSVAPHRVETRRADGWVVMRADDAVAADETTAVPPNGTAVTGEPDGTEVTGESNGTATRTDEPTPRVTARTVRSLNSTVLVDRRGIVRSVEQRFEVQEDGGANRTVVRSFAVTEVGSAHVERPRWVCIAERNGHVSVP